MSWQGVKTQLGEVRDAYLDPLFDKPDSLTEILQKIKDKELGIEWWEEETRKLNALKNLIPKKRQEQIGSILSQVKGAFDKAWEDAETVENWWDLPDVIAAGGAHGINLFNQGVGLLSEGVAIGLHHGARIHKPAADLGGNVAGVYLTRKLMNKGIGLANKAIASNTAHNIAFKSGQKVNQLSQRFKPVNQRTIDAQAFDPSRRIVAETSASVFRKGGLFSGPGGSGSTLVKESQAIARAVSGKAPTGKEMYAFLATKGSGVPYTQVRGKSQIRQQQFRSQGLTELANKMYRIDIALMNGNLYEAKKLAKNIKINSREIQTLPTASISDKRGYIDMKGGEIVQQYGQKSTSSPGNIAPPRGGLLTSKVDEVLNNKPLNISQFKNVHEIKEAKIQYQKELDLFRLTELGILTLEDAYNYYGINRSLSGFKAPPGYTVRVKGTVNVDEQKGLSLVSKPIRDLEQIKRQFPQEPDESSILPLFQNAVGQAQAPAEVASYINTSKKIYDEIGKAITRYNKEQGRVVLTKEHIFDVNFHNLLQEIVGNFSGKGANELGNISIMNLSLNSSLGGRAGAIRDKIVDPVTGAVDYPSVTDLLIKNVQEGVGVDYKKSVGDFVDYDIGKKIKNFSKQDWDWLLKEIIDSQDTGITVQDILVESMKKIQSIEDALSY